MSIQKIKNCLKQSTAEPFPAKILIFYNSLTYWFFVEMPKYIGFSFNLF